MTNKRKSMNTGDDVHAIAPEVRSRRFICDQRVIRDAALTSLGVWGTTGIACPEKLLWKQFLIE